MFTDNTSLPPEPEFEPTPVSIEVAEVGLPGTPPGTFSPFRSLGCLIKPRSLTFETEWLLPDGSSISFSEGRFALTSFDQPDQINLLLVIADISYFDEGVYTCRYRDTGTSSNSKWISNTTELLLPGILDITRLFHFMVVLNLQFFWKHTLQTVVMYM